jgi:Ca2+-binding EF-hand superfamily protein
MNGTTVLAIVAAALALVATPSLGAKTALGDSPSGLAQKSRMLVMSDFDKADRDNSGMLDKTEAAAMADVGVHFDAIDTDRNGKVSREEIQTYGRFSKQDRNGDGKLDPVEARGWWIVSKNFDAIDTDSGGTVSLPEINAYLSARKLHFANAR